MRIIVVSDTHGKWALLHSVVLSQPRADIVIHLGDGEDDLENVQYDFTGKMMVGVPGNCDYSSRRPLSDTIRVEKKTIFFSHGHMYSVKSGLGGLLAAAKAQHADICLFGHTHVPMTDYINGMYIMNPGSLGYPHDRKPTYGIIDITSAGIFTSIIEYK